MSPTASEVCASVCLITAQALCVSRHCTCVRDFFDFASNLFAPPPPALCAETWLRKAPGRAWVFLVVKEDFWVFPGGGVGHVGYMMAEGWRAVD